MANVRFRPDIGRLYFDFHYQGVRCREYTTLDDSATNRRKMESVLKKIASEMSLGTFEYARYFPNSKMVARFAAPAPIFEAALAVSPSAAPGVNTPTFSAFAQTWQQAKKVEWRRSYTKSVAEIVETHLVPFFGTTPVGAIDRAQVLDFRTKLAEPSAQGKVRAPATVNRVVGILKQILDESVMRHGGSNPCQGIKQLRLKKIDILPFSIEEVRRIIDAVRPDYKSYLTVRFFTGMRSGEVHGLRWKHIDFTNRQILVRETYANGQVEYTKTDGSQREVSMSAPVFDALQALKPENPDPEAYVFCSRNGFPIDNHNFVNRVWSPLLRYLELKPRRPYQMRHTCATLWLASGENPNWISRQLGHTNTEMLFRVYSRYVPNLTRQDGSAFDRMVTGALNGGIHQERANEK